MKHNYIKWLIAIMLGLTFAGCQTAATPKTTQVKTDNVQALHTLLQDVAVYKGYTLIQDNNRDTMIIQYTRDNTIQHTRILLHNTTFKNNNTHYCCTTACTQQK